MDTEKKQWDRDREQDEMIQRNAESIRRNEEAILRQTRALEQIRDHYFPKRTLWASVVGFFLKAIGAVTVAAGILEAADWYWNTRQANSMAKQFVVVANRLFMKENDTAGAMKFLEKAVELDGDKFKYRIQLEYVRALEVINDMFDLERPLTADERRRVDDILSESIFLQEADPANAIPHVLASQAYVLRGELDAAKDAQDRALALEPESTRVQIGACSLSLSLGDVAAAQRHVAEAERIDPEFPLVLYWKSLLALIVERDRSAALEGVSHLLMRIPRYALAHVLKGWILMSEPNADLQAARAAFSQALKLSPNMVRAMVLMAETYEREGDWVIARLWLDRALWQDEKCMGALITRARIRGKEGNWELSIADLTTAIGLAPFRADLYEQRAAARASAGDKIGATADQKIAATLKDGAHP